LSEVLCLTERSEDNTDAEDCMSSRGSSGGMWSSVGLCNVCIAQCCALPGRTHSELCKVVAADCRNTASGFGGLVVSMLASGTFGGLVVSMLASGTQDRGFNPAEAIRIFFGRKDPQHAFLRKGSKAVCPMSQICGMLKNPIIYLGSRKL
jgi:hypothetical protein